MALYNQGTCGGVVLGKLPKEDVLTFGPIFAIMVRKLKKQNNLKQTRMTRFFKTFIGSVVSVALVASLTTIATAAVPVKDKTAPSDVEKLTVVSGDASVALTWEAATDDVQVKSYKVYYGAKEVTSKNTNKYEKSVDAGNVTTYTLKGLTNGTKYFVAVTAVDTSTNESESYSPYVSAVPMGGVVAQTSNVVKKDTTTAVAAKTDAAKADGPDTTAPTLKKAESLNKNQVRVVFSEKAVLPTEKPELAFTVVDNYVYETLKVKSATADAADTTGATFILETEEQSPNSEYIVTAGIEIEDAAGNPINSGTSDTAPFTGSSVTKAEYIALHPEVKTDVVADASDVVAATEVPTKGAAPTGFVVTGVEVIDEATIKVSLSKPGVYSIDAIENFEITKKGDTATLELSSVFVDDNKKDILVTSIFEDGVEYTLTLKSVVDQDGKEMDSGKNTFDFKIGAAAVADTTPPEEVTNLVAKALKNMGAKMNWTGSKNVAGDLLEYIVYTSTDDGKTYGKVVSLAKENTAYEAKELTPGYHWFKVTSKDKTGNESVGKMVKIKIVETGPGIGLLALASIGLGRLFGKKKKV